MPKRPSLRRSAIAAAAVCTGLSVLAPAADAEVAARSTSGFLLKASALVSGTPQAAYERAVGAIDRWWDPAHTYSGRSANLSLEPRAGGCFCERLDGGGSVQHLTVGFLQPGRTVRLLGGLGPLQSLAASGALTWQFEPVAEQTRVTWTYRVTGLEPDGVAAMASAVDQVISGQLVRLGRFIDTGQP